MSWPICPCKAITFSVEKKQRCITKLFLSSGKFAKAFPLKAKLLKHYFDERSRTVTHAWFSSCLHRSCLVLFYLLLCSRTPSYTNSCRLFIFQSTPTVLHRPYTADYWPGIHTTAFLFGHVNTKTQRKHLSIFSASCLNVALVDPNGCQLSCTVHETKNMRRVDACCAVCGSDRDVKGWGFRWETRKR